MLVNYIRQYQIDNGVPKAQAYSVTMYIMCGLLLIGFLCNFAMRAVDEKYHFRGSDRAMKARLIATVDRGWNSAIVGGVENARKRAEVISVSAGGNVVANTEFAMNMHLSLTGAAGGAGRRHSDPRHAASCSTTSSRFI